MDVSKKLDEIVDAVAGARSMPMSASCVVNRAELLAMLEEVRAALPGSLAQAQEVLGGRAQMVEQARQEADRIIESAHAQRGSLISDTEVARQSREEADRILTEARREAEEIRTEADDYVDSKLANFEVVLTKTIGAVDRGREKLLGRVPGGDGMTPDGRPDDAPERSADPETLRRRADEYVDAKLGAVSAVLAKTLEAAGRGRQKLLGARPIDELGAHMAAQDAAQDPAALHHTSDADFLAGLAGHAAPQAPAVPQPPTHDPVPPVPSAQPDIPAAPTMPPRIPAPAAQQDYYAATADYQQQGGYGYPESYAQGHDPYAAQPATAGYPQQDPYGWQQPQASGYEGYDGYATGGGYGGHGHPAQPAQHGTQGAALDETSLFDTSMINLDQLRQYEQGR
ncbi:ATP synthase F0 subunit B [Streptomyces sp. LX-29]|uniref:ATP synthase F0 subunit B n=1 Tax=Streptomyces sp. LX-29 TaxID=2900152 RepID=UPI00240DA688|nr:ATP synthase F0 subunit B [Streptomyces sp. LX-29]WFB07198.1 ATP synthase F0 subunit B [Streptomyces sp. LX-29]